MKAAGINPGEAAIRRGAFEKRWPATFPSGQGSDLAGVVEAIGDGVTRWSHGDEIVGFTNERASHADLVVVPERQLTARPFNVPWEQAGALFVAGTTAYAAVHAVSLRAGDTLVVSGAAAGLGRRWCSSQPARAPRCSAWRALAITGGSENTGSRRWLYGEGIAARVREFRGKIDAFIDTFGHGYVDLAIELGVAPERVNTVIDFASAQKQPGVKTAASHEAANAGVLAELIELMATGRLEIPIARVYPLANVREANRELELRHTRGKIVLVP